MTEDEAKTLVSDAVSRETMDQLELLIRLVIDENDRQNLIAPSTVPVMWSRHILDSAQLVWLAGNRTGGWVDIGAGAGFPGLVAALLRDGPTMLIEPRAKRAAFLQTAATALGIDDHMEVVASRIEMVRMADCPGIISARAVAALPALFAMAAKLAGPETLWILPKGRSAREEVADALREWQGDIRLVPSLSDPESAIVVARDVRRKKGV